MFGWRITKYNPVLRDSKGRFLGEDWTSIADVGKVIAGSPVTMEEYLAVEGAYLGTVAQLFEETGTPAVGVPAFEVYSEDELEQVLSSEPELRRALKEIQSERRAPAAAVPGVCRLILREILWCKFENPGDLYLHFGGDYYMYVGSARRLSLTLSLARSRGLFVEDLVSPYLEE
jgi:hypothetical protein